MPLDHDHISGFKSITETRYLLRSFAEQLVRLILGAIRLSMLTCQHEGAHVAPCSFHPSRFDTYYNITNLSELLITYSKITHSTFLHTFKYINMMRGIYIRRLLNI